MNPIIKLAISIILIACIAACTTTPLVVEPKVSHNSAVLSLYESAQLLTSSGQYEQAKSQLQRALRIESQNAWLWYELAIVHNEEGDAEKALNIAARANSFASDKTLKQHLNIFIEELKNQ